MYALADNVCMAFVGLGLIGPSASFIAGTVHTYIGEMGTVMDDIRKKQGKKLRKIVLHAYAAYLMSSLEDYNDYRIVIYVTI